MTESISTREFIDRLVQQSGIKKKLAAEVLRMIPEIIEEGLKRDGEVKVKGLGTFRMKWTLGRIGRNPKTGQEVEIPPHNRLVFLPEQSLKEYINRDYRLLGYKVIPEAEPETAGSQQPVPGAEPEGSADIIQSEEFKVQSEDSLEINPESPSPPEEIDYSYEPEPEKPKHRRIHWIIPTVILVIIGLSVAFYFRNFNPVLLKKSEDRRPKAYIVTRDSISSQQLADTAESEKFKVQSEDTTINSKQQAPNNQGPVTHAKSPETQNPEPITPVQNSAVRIQNSEGKHLFQLARETYGNPFLWVLIFKANLDKIPNPDVVISNVELVIPVLEGKPRKLSRNDSLEVAEGYRLVYEYYLGKGNPKAEEFRQAHQNYKPR